MKMKFIVTLMILVPFFAATNTRATEPGIPGKDTIIKKEKRHKDYYKTWTVVEVTDDEIMLERTKSNDEIEKVSISRSRRPSLEVGDKVRYDKIRDRLRKTLSK